MTKPLIQNSHGKLVSPLKAMKSWLAVSDDYREQNGDDLDENELWALRDLADCARLYLETR